VPYEDYWDKDKIFLDEIVFLGIPEVATRIEALKSGDIDLMFNLDAQSVAGLEAHDDTTVLRASTSAIIAMDMNNTIPPFDNKLVRQAMQAAMDRELINQAALLGLGTIAYDHPIHPSDPFFAPQYAPPEYNPELARSLLEQAGYPDGIDVTLHTADIGSGVIEMAVAFKESAAPAGIRVEVKRGPADAFWDSVWFIEPFTVTRWLGRLPDQMLMETYDGESIWNAPRYNNPVVNDLIIEARGQDLQGQKESYAEIQRILIDDVPRLIPAFQAWLMGMRTDVRGVDIHPLGFMPLNDAWLDD
jgi:peptide/nickel transport system substrate-binding protein